VINFNSRGFEFAVSHLAYNRLMAVLFVSLLAIAAANAQKPADRGDADAGRDLAEQACTGCHVVSPDQPFPPLLKGAPDFREIANRAKGAWRTHTLPTTNSPTWRPIS
jgi:cytochrome c2